jgi:hypothetical protein
MGGSEVGGDFAVAFWWVSVTALRTWGSGRALVSREEGLGPPGVPGWGRGEAA